MTTTTALAVPAFVVPDARVSWSTWCGTATVTVTAVSEFRISYRSADGVSGAWEATCVNTLAEALPRRDFRPAD